MRDYIGRILRKGAAVSPPVIEGQAVPTPTLWLLGKTGAGKSSLVRALTGESQVGDGFAPCTRTAMAYEYPAGRPVLRFLDTRGIGEVGYDPSEDLAEAGRGSHAVLVVARLDDPVQGAVADILRELRRRRRDLPILVAHTGADLAESEAVAARARAATQERFETATGDTLPSVTLALPPEEDGVVEGLDALRDAIAKLLPDAALVIMRERIRDAETARFAEIKPLVMWYAGAAAASDVAPVIGAVGVPAIQGAMLHAMAGRYGVTWTANRAGAFAGALGSGALLRFAGSHAARQAAKLVPVVGQTLGAASAAAISFATTFALGRAAAYWLDRESRGESASADDLRRLYEEAFARARDVPR
ncbi:MAG: 50S ribosome-binding GTPase [Salinarimonas sp.]|nr:50S ribosome-binding GTPase [Salinarimonas sp.]